MPIKFVSSSTGRVHDRFSDAIRDECKVEELIYRRDMLRQKIRSTVEDYEADVKSLRSHYEPRLLHMVNEYRDILKKLKHLED